jgi:uncharacterized membrane protein YsdA (DUF1294 family)/cold shock CspA family protein
MRFAGHIKSWNAERGFGFIEPSGGGQEIFLHVSAVPTQLRPPKIGQHFTFEVELNRDGKKRAANVGVAVVPRRVQPRKSESPARWDLGSALAIPGFIAIYVALALTKGVSIWFAAAYALLSIICLLAYAFDKSAAVAGRWRASEQSLLLLGLAGGWPGGLLAQQLLRHKSSKASFRSAFWGTVVLNVTAFVLFHVYSWPGQAAAWSKG